MVTFVASNAFGCGVAVFLIYISGSIYSGPVSERVARGFKVNEHVGHETAFQGERTSVNLDREADERNKPYGYKFVVAIG